MKNANGIGGVLASGALLLGVNCLCAQDWPQWRGANRDAKATGFNAPKTWPKQLTQKWKVPVGDGVATPALVGDKLYVFTREGGDEIIRCLDAVTGKEIWQDKYEAQGATGPAARFPGPRSSPTVADGKVLTLGVRGTLSCLDAATGKIIWRKNDVKGTPRFFTSSSPIVVAGLCIAQLGGGKDGAIVAYDLATGDQKWIWKGDSPAYASLVLLPAGDTKLLIGETETKVLAVDSADGKLAWDAPFTAPQRSYNAATPIVNGQTMIYGGGGRGTKAVKFAKEGNAFAATELWSNAAASVQFNTPVLKDGLIYGLSQGNEFFCVSAESGKTLWTAPAVQGSGSGQSGQSGRRGGGGSGYGSIVDAGPVLIALTPTGQLTVFEPSDKEFKPVAKYKVADANTYAYPVLSGNRIFVKDRDSLILWAIE
jgi:outer membrane protein assembly factor BamB